MLLEFGVIFEKLDTEEYRSQNDGQNQEDDQCFPFVGFGAVNRQSHGEAAANQHRRVDAAQQNIQVIARRRKRLQVPVSVNEITCKHTAEKHDLGCKKHPHAEPRGLVLLLDIVEVMLPKNFYLRHGPVSPMSKSLQDPFRKRKRLRSLSESVQSFPWEAAREFAIRDLWHPRDFSRQRRRSVKTKSDRSKGADSRQPESKRPPST